LLLSLRNRIHLDGYTTVYLSIHAVMGIWDFFQVLADFFGRNDAKAETPVLLPGKFHGQRSMGLTVHGVATVRHD
jgi:hypothetical protein